MSGPAERTGWDRQLYCEIADAAGNSARTDTVTLTLTVPPEETPASAFLFDAATGEIRGNDRTLTRVVIPARIDGAAVKTVRLQAFYGYRDLTEALLPEGVEEIGAGAFYACSSLRTVTIPRSVTHIAGVAFLACGSLVEVRYAGTPAQWAAIQIDENNDALSAARIVYGGQS